MKYFLKVVLNTLTLTLYYVNHAQVCSSFKPLVHLHFCVVVNLLNFNIH